jgi:hypothetical protein
MVRGRYSHGRECPSLHRGVDASVALPQRTFLFSTTLPLGFSTEGGTFGIGSRQITRRLVILR